MAGPGAEKDGDETDLGQVRRHFLKKAKQGVILNSDELLRYAQSKKLASVSPKDLRKLKEEWKFTAMHQRVTKPQDFMATENFRYGVCQVDMGFMKKTLREHNDGHWGFIVCVEVSSLQLAAEPVRDKSKKSWNRGLASIVETSSINKIGTLISDRERALTSELMIKKLRENFGIKMVFLKSRNKAYYAERFIGVIKRMLSMGMRYARKRKDPEAKNWVRFLKPIVEHLNSRKVPGTKFTRKSVNEFNFMQMLDQKKGGFANELMNMTSVQGCRFGGRTGWGKDLFKFKLNERVLVDRRALTGHARRKVFTKTSLSGGFSPLVYIVVKRKLRSSGPGRYTPVYKLRKNRSSEWEDEWYYQTDLQRLADKRNEQDSPSEEEEEEEEEAAAAAAAAARRQNKRAKKAKKR